MTKKTRSAKLAAVTLALLALTAGLGARAGQTFVMRRFLGEVQTGVASTGNLPAMTATVGHLFSYTFPTTTFRSSMSGGLTYSATLNDGTPLPAWLSFNTSAMTFSGTPRPADEGSLNILITARNSANNAARVSLPLTVTNPAPTVLTPIPDRTLTAFLSFSFTLDPDTFSNNPDEFFVLSAAKTDGTALPAWLSFDPILATFSGTAPASGSLDVRVTATDEGSHTSDDVFTLSIQNPAPIVANAIPDQDATMDEAFSFTFADDAFTDNAGDALTYSATLSGGAALPAWLSFDSATRTFSSAAMGGSSLTIRVTATDLASQATSTSFTIHTANPVPVLANAIPDQSSTMDEAFSFTFADNTFADNPGDTLTYSATLSGGAALPAWLSFNNATRTFSGTPAIEDEDITIQVTASDTAGQTATALFELFVFNPPPTVAKIIPNQSAELFMPFSFTIAADTFADNAGDILTYSATLGMGDPLPAWLSFDAENRTFSGTSTAAGDLGIMVIATDTMGMQASTGFLLSFSNDIPVLANAIPDQTGTALATFSYTIPEDTFTDTAGDTLSWSAGQTNGTALPAWLSFDTATRTFSGTPASMGTTSILVTVTDTSGGTASDDFDIAIAQDTTPDAFTLAPVPNATTSTVTTLASPVTLTGFSDTLTASVAGSGSPQISVNGGAWGASASMIPGDTLSVRLTASSSFNTAASATVTVGGTSATFTVTTAAQDTAPNSFAFTATTGAALASTQTSNTVTISGITGFVPISVSGGSYKIGSGTYTTSAGTIMSGQTVTLQATSSGSYNTTTTATLTVGSGSATWSITTYKAAAMTLAPTSATMNIAAASATVGTVTYSAATTFTLANCSGCAPTTLISTTLSNATNFEFTGTNSCAGSILAGGTSCTFQIRAKATNNATLTPSTLTATATNGGSKTAALTGTATGYAPSLYAWGYNGDKMLADGTTTNRSTPIAIAGLTNVTAATGERTHACAIASGKLYCWGANGSGQLGDGTTTSHTTPNAVSNMTSGVTAVAVGENHTCAIKTSRLYCWGSNSNGQIGDSTTTVRNTPVEITTVGTSVTAVTTGYAHTCAIASGKVYCWGMNTVGQLGDGTTTQHTAPTAISSLASNVTAISTKHNHTCAIKGGQLYCWGYNIYGQLGDNSTTDKKTPVLLNNMTSGVTMVTTGYYHTCAFKSNTLYCWGYNGYGNLGNGSTTNSSTPVMTSLQPPVLTALSAGGSHTCMIVYGKLYCWGYNGYGQLGDGTTTQRNSPVLISSMGDNVSVLGVGTDYTMGFH